jgi:transcriptional regulator with XRE-family HTH domain
MNHSNSTGTPDTGRPGLRARQARVESGFWPRSGPLSAEVRQALADGFGARVRALRGERGMTQVKLAELLCCDPRTIRRLERGEHRPSRQQVAWLAAALAPEGEHPMSLDHVLLDLVGDQSRPWLSRKHRRRGLLSGLYTLPIELNAERRALEAQVRRMLSGRR